MPLLSAMNLTRDFHGLGQTEKAKSDDAITEARSFAKVGIVAQFSTERAMVAIEATKSAMRKLAANHGGV